MNSPTLVDRIGSFTVVPNAFVDDARVGSEAFRVFVFLRRHVNSAREANGETVVWPAYDAIMLGTEIKRRATLANALHELEREQWLVRHRRFGKSTRYILQMPDRFYQPKGPSSSDVGTTAVKSASSSNGGTISSANGGTVDSSDVRHANKTNRNNTNTNQTNGATQPTQVPFSDPVVAYAERHGITVRAARARIAKDRALATEFEIGPVAEADPGVVEHRKVCGYVPLTVGDAVTIIETVRRVGVESWGTNLLEWIAAGYNPANVAGQCSRAENRQRSASAAERLKALRPDGAKVSNGYRPGKPTTNPQVPDPTPAERQAAEDRARAQRAERRAGKVQA